MKRSPKPVRAFFVLLASIILLAPSYFRILENFEQATLDFRFKIRPIQIQNKDIAIIEIANDTLQKIGRWPFKRNWHAALIDILSAYGAKIIIFDALFCEPSPEDPLLIQSTKNAGNVYYSYSFDLTSAKKDKKNKIIEVERIDTFLIPGLQKSARNYGFINVVPDKDGKTRRAPIRLKFKNKVYPHLALLAASDYLGKDFSEIDVPADDLSFALINFAGRWEDTYKHYSYVDILKSYSLVAKGEKGIIDLDEFKDKVCFIGLTATGTHDLNPVPFQERYPGLGIHINLFNTIVTQNFLRRAGKVTNLIILILLAFITGLVTLKARPVTSSIFIISAISAFCIIAIAIFIFANLWIDLLYPVIALFVIYMTLTFYKYVSERQKRQLIEKELEVARKIQQSFLPSKSPEIEGTLLTAEMTSAEQVGGDLYDFVELEEGKIGIMVGDVSGKGVPAALYMARAVSLFRLLSKSGLDTKDTLTKLNDALAEESTTNLFVTLSYLIYDAKKHLLMFSSGGHLPTLLLKKGDEKCRLLTVEKGLPLGLMPDEYSNESVTLLKGDILVLYTDGVTEAMNIKAEEFGQDRLTSVVEENRNLGSQAMLVAIKNAIFKFSRPAPQHDDITIIVMEVSA